MRKIAFTFNFLVLIFIKSNAQHDPNFTPFACGAAIGGFLCSANPNQNGLNEINKNPAGGFSIGGVLSFRKRQYYFETGLNYIKEGYAYSAYVNTNNKVNNQQNEYKFYSVMLPLRFVIPIQGTYCKHLPSIGVNLAYGMQTKLFQTIEYENAPLTKNVYDIESDYNKITPSFTVAYGIEYDIDMNHTIRLEPTVQFSVINAKEAANKTMISNFGLRAYFLFLR